MLRKNSFYLSRFILIGLGLILVAIVSLLIYLKTMTNNKSGTYLIPTYTEGRITRVVPQAPLNDQLFTDAEIMDFAVEAMQQTLALSFDDYESSMSNAAEKYFTESGWTKFSHEIETSEIYKTLFINKEIINITPTRAPFMIYSGPVDGPINGKQVKDAYWTWRIKYSAKMVKRPLNSSMTSTSTQDGINHVNNQQNLSIEFVLDLQRVPKGKGARAVKIIDSHDWKVRYGA